MRSHPASHFSRAAAPLRRPSASISPATMASLRYAPISTIFRALRLFPALNDKLFKDFCGFLQNTPKKDAKCLLSRTGFQARFRFCTQSLSICCEVSWFSHVNVCSFITHYHGTGYCRRSKPLIGVINVSHKTPLNSTLSPDQGPSQAFSQRLGGTCPWPLQTSQERAGALDQTRRAVCREAAQISCDPAP